MYFSTVSIDECVCAQVLHSCLTLCHSMDCSLPGSSVSGILQVRILDGLPCPPPGELPNPGIKSVLPAAPALQVDSLPLSDLGKLPLMNIIMHFRKSFGNGVSKTIIEVSIFLKKIFILNAHQYKHNTMFTWLILWTTRF